MDRLQMARCQRLCREQLGLTREAFAEGAKLSPPFLAELENGKKSPPVDTLCRLCQEFTISADYLLLGRLEEGESPHSKLWGGIPTEHLPLAEGLVHILAEHFK